MKFKKAVFLLILSLTITINLKAQLKEGYKAEIEVQAIGTTNGTVPFWMRSNQFGSIPLNGVSGSVIGRLSKEYDELSTSDKLYGRKKVFDWGFGLEGRANGGRNSNLQLIEGYVKAKAWIFQLKGGRSKDVVGLNGDTLLSSGNFAQSGNALGIPKFEISIPEYYRLPILNGLLSFKGTFSHGFVGKARILSQITYGRPPTVYPTNNQMPVTYLHSKSLYGRLGMENWKLSIFGGFNHQAFWGNEKDAYGDTFRLSTLNTFLYVATGKAYGNKGIPNSKIGNQLGSIDIGTEYKFESIVLSIYRQAFYDVGALSKLANIKDGLTGITISNSNFNEAERGFQLKKILFEMFYSKDQAGYPTSIPTASGDEDYYNNYYYIHGWSYKGLNLGNPLITQKKDARSNQATRENDYFINNRVVAIHGGITAKISDINIKSKATFSWNYGTFGTSKYGNSTGPNRDPQTENLFVPVQQMSLFIEAEKNLNNHTILGLSSAFDNGLLLNNSFGFMCKVKKSF